MNRPETLSVPASLGGVHEALDALSDWSVRHDLPESSRRRLLTVLDEVLSNVVRHSTPGGDEVIDVTCRLGDGRITVQVADRGGPFNPLLHAAPDVSAPLDRREVGGLGIALVRSLADDVEYERRDDRNLLTLTWHT